MKLKIIGLFTTILFFFSCNSKLETFNKEYSEFKNKNIHLLNKNYHKLLSFDKLVLRKDSQNMVNKQFIIDLSKNNFNTLIVEKMLFDKLNNKNTDRALFNPIIKNNLFYLKRMLEGDEDKIHFLKEIRKDGFNFDELSNSMINYKKYISFCKNFIQLDYIIINKTNQIVYPELLPQEGSDIASDGIPSAKPGKFYKGFYSATAYLFDFNTKKLLGSFNYKASNSNLVNKSKSDKFSIINIYEDLNKQINKSFKQKLNKLYSVKSYEMDNKEFVTIK